MSGNDADVGEDSAPVRPGPLEGTRSGGTRSRREPLTVDPDFAREILDELYAYRRKRRLVAWVLWATLGWLGAHRFYLEKPGTGLLQMLTGGGLTLWWIVDAWRLGRMVDAHNRDQALREARDEPPIELDFMPPLGVDVLSEPPAWALQWEARGPGWRALRITGDVTVLMVAGASLGVVAATLGATEAVFAVVGLVLVTLLGGGGAWLEHVPLARGLLRWTHRLRLFYYFNKPGNPVAMLFRGALGLMLAPFRRRDRAETRLYLELGAAFTVFFVVLDVVQDVAVPLVTGGLSALAPLRLATIWFEDLVETFVVTYVFVAPIGAVLTLYLLTRRTHTVPRILGLLVLAFIVVGLGAGL